MIQDKTDQDDSIKPEVNQNKKTISLKTISLMNQEHKGESIFRKPKKVIKTLKIDTQSKFEDKVFIKEEFQNWISKLSSNKDRENSKEKIKFKLLLSERNKEVLSTVYDLMRNDEKLAQYLPSTSTNKITIKKHSLKLNLEEVSNLRSKSSKRKVAIEQICFQSQISSKQRGLSGFRPTASRRPQRLAWNKKNILIKTPKVNNVSFFRKSQLLRTYSLQNQQQKSQNTYNSNLQKSSKSIFDSPSRIGNYSSRSRQNKSWQTIGLKEWVNKVTVGHSYLSKF